MAGLAAGINRSLFDKNSASAATLRRRARRGIAALLSPPGKVYRGHFATALRPAMSASARPATVPAGRRWGMLPVSLCTLAVLGAAAPWIVASAIAVLSVDATTPIEWVPETFPPRRAYDRFTQQFESGDVVVATWPGCRAPAW